MSSYVAQEQPEQQRMRLDALRRAKAERVDSDMLARLRQQQRLHRIDGKIADLREMLAGTTHERLKQMLSNELVKLGNAREAITTC
jgi:hypothetical protein